MAMEEKRNVGGQEKSGMGQTGQPGQTGRTGTTGTTGAGGVGGGMGNIPQEFRRHFENVDFPVSKNELVDQIGTKNVNLGGKNINLKEVINKVQKDRFQNQDELLRELQNLPEMKNIGGGVSGGMGGVGGMGGTTGGGQQRRQ